jgi:DNA-binding NarL/FixJ family response regulator
MTTGILLADDQELMRMGFRMVIDSQPDLEVVGEASNGHEAIDATRRLAPDVVLMDVRMPEFDLDEYVYAGLRAGASGFLLKDAQPAELLAAIRAVASGDAVVSPRVTRRLLSQYAHRLPAVGTPEPSPSTPVSQLTGREHEVLLEIAQGLSNAEIADKLVLSEATVKTHVGRILAKLELRDRVQIVVFAYETALIKPAVD